MYLLFDFDGTLVDSLNCVIEKAILLSKTYNFKTISDKEIETLKELSTKELIQSLHIPLYQIPTLIRQMRRHLKNEMPNLEPAAHILPVIESLHLAQFSLGILTSNSIDNVSSWLKTHDVAHFFDFIHTESQFLSKRRLLKKTIKSYQIDKTRTFYIGDETRDIEAAKKNKIKSIAVTWGYHSEQLLVKHQPEFIARHPDDLLKICAEHQR